MALLVPFGLKNGVLYEPRQVLNGKSCDCICPGCSHPLIARQNAQTPHFAHAAGEDCKKGFETAIHLAAKQLIAERMELAMPAVDIQLPGGWGYPKSPQLLYVSHLKPLSDVCIEPWLDDFRPDLVVVESVTNSRILVEIAVAHFVDEVKLSKIKKSGVHAIELDVSAARENMDFSLLKRFLFETPSSGKWLYHPKAEQLEIEYIDKREQEWEAKKKETIDRFESYRILNPREKIRRNLEKAQISAKTLKVLTSFVPGEKAYEGGRFAWQSAVLAYIAKQVEEYGIEGKSLGCYLEPESVVYWLSKLFDINATFPDAEKIALWKYFKYLETLGLLKQRKTSFEILIIPRELKVL